MTEMWSLVPETAGWGGALCTAAAYALVSRRRIEPDSLAFQSLNLLGAALLAVSAAASHAWPSVTANFVWMLIGAQTLVGARRVLGARRSGADDANYADHADHAAPEHGTTEFAVPSAPCGGQSF